MGDLFNSYNYIKVNIISSNVTLVKVRFSGVIWYNPIKVQEN